jgi:hypothetical protein
MIEFVDDGRLELGVTHPTLEGLVSATPPPGARCRPLDDLQRLVPLGVLEG